MNITYVSASTLLSGDANAVHVASICDAFRAAGHQVQLRARCTQSDENIVQYYGLRHPFEIALENTFTRILWLVSRVFAARQGLEAGGRVYYGRNLPVLRWLGALGHSVALELHYLPRPAKLRLVEKLVESRRFLGLVVISEALKRSILDSLPKLPESAVMVAHDGFRSDTLKPVRLRDAGAPVRVVYSGSFHQGKGVTALIGAARLLPDIEFHVFGGTPAQVAERGASSPSNIRFHGRVGHAEVAERLADCDIALAPYSRTVHGINQRPDSTNLALWMSPLKLFEYMAAGVPIITSDLPVIRELLMPGESALMVDPDHVEDLANAIKSLADSPVLRLSLAQAARLRLEPYSWDHRAGAITEFLQRRSLARGG